MTIRKGLGRGKGMGYKNLVPHDRPVHRDSGRGIKQPQIKSIPPVMMKPTMRKTLYGWKDIAPFGEKPHNPYVTNVKKFITEHYNGRNLEQIRLNLKKRGVPTEYVASAVLELDKEGKLGEKVVGGLGDDGIKWTPSMKRRFDTDEHAEVLRKVGLDYIKGKITLKEFKNRQLKSLKGGEKIIGGLGDKLIVNKDHPEWGTWRVRLEPRGQWYEITGDSGTRVLHFDEAKKFWKEVPKEKIVGGLGDGRPDSDFPKAELKKGMKVEAEHTNNPAIAKEIVKDHLTEFPKGYYEELDKMEKKLKKEQPKIERWNSGGLYIVQSFAFDTPNLKKTMSQQQMVRFAKESLKSDRKNGQDVAGITMTDLNNPLNAWVYLKNMGYAVEKVKR